MIVMLDFAIDLARAAGAVLRNRYERGFTLDRKSSEIDLVTDADRESEALILSAIRDRFPEHRILAEESFAAGEHPRDAAGPADYTWIVDPLDGTTNFAHGFPMFCVSIGVQRGPDLVLGVVYDPLRDELFTAERGAGVFLNGHRRRVSPNRRLVESVVATGFAYDKATIPNNNVAEFSRVVLKVQGIRRAGSAALDLAYVATGRLDGYWEMNRPHWDWAAGALMVVEGGGVLTGMHGEPWHLDLGEGVATNGLIHAELIGALSGHES